SGRRSGGGQQGFTDRREGDGAGGRGDEARVDQAEPGELVGQRHAVDGQRARSGAAAATGGHGAQDGAVPVGQGGEGGGGHFGAPSGGRRRLSLMTPRVRRTHRRTDTAAPRNRRV